MMNARIVMGGLYACQAFFPAGVAGSRGQGEIFLDSLSACRILYEEPSQRLRTCLRNHESGWPLGEGFPESQGILGTLRT